MNSLLRSWKGSKTCITMYTRRSMKWSESPRNAFQSGTKSYDDTAREKLRLPIGRASLVFTLRDVTRFTPLLAHLVQ